MILPNIWKNKKMFQTTNQKYIKGIYVNIFAHDRGWNEALPVLVCKSFGYKGQNLWLSPGVCWFSSLSNMWV